MSRHSRAERACNQPGYVAAPAVAGSRSPGSRLRAGLAGEIADLLFDRVILGRAVPILRPGRLLVDDDTNGPNRAQMQCFGRLLERVQPRSAAVRHDRYAIDVR